MATLLSLFRRSLPDVNGALLRRLAGDNVSVAHAQGRTLELHLRGTQRVLEAWRQSAYLQRAGLCHSLYSTDAFARESVPLTNRARVQQAIGKQSEELVFLFCAIQRAPFTRSMVRAVSFAPSETIPIEVRSGFEAAGHRVSGVQATDLLLLYLANMAEQAGTHTGRMTPWLEQFQRLVQLLIEKAPEAVPEVLLQFRGFGRYVEREALAAYLRAIRMSSNPEKAIPLMEEVARLLPPLGDPHVWLAWLWLQHGDASKRKHHAELAAAKFLALGTTWDKRLPFDDWLNLARLAKISKSSGPAFSSLQSLIEEGSPQDLEISSAEDLESDTSTRSRFESYLMDVGAAKSRRVSSFYPGLREDSFWNPGQFAIDGELRAAFPSIQAEVDTLQPNDFHNESEGIQRSGKWQVYMLLEAGRWHEENLERLPVLSRILKQAPELRLAGGLVYLSRLTPGTVVAPHTGPTNMRLRLHFAIHVPEGDCALRVADEQCFWVQGECTVFNDFLKHEVWNRTQEERLILLIDIWHPDITLQERKMLDAIHWMSEQHGRSLLDYWRKNEVARTDARAVPHLRSAEIDDLVL